MDARAKNNAKGYHGHRGRQRERILRVAETLFLRDGIEMVGVNDIAVAANVTRTTIYRYFANRDDIVWGVLRLQSETLLSKMPVEVYNRALSAATRLQMVLNVLMNHFIQHPEHALFDVQFDYFLARNPDITKMKEFKKEVYSHESPLLRLIERGMNDGSLRPNIDATATDAAMLAVIWGISRRFAHMYHTFEYEHRYSIREIYEEACDIMLRGIRTDH
jgi:AcrR family transcriptional regulator